MSLKNLYILICLLAVFVLAQLKVNAQTDSLKSSFEFLPRPQLEIGTGVFSYFGDIGNLGGHGKNYNLNWAYNLGLNNPISNSFNLNLFVLYGKVGASEQFTAGNANFETEIKMGGLSLEYNFNALLPKTRNVTPYVSLGITTFEFNPKGDLYDAQGNEYHYWDDGTIRRGINSPLKENASDLLIRDYNYETDLRERNDQSERYDLRALSVPISAGAMLKLTDNFTMRMGATFHFALSDNIDNINSENTTYTSSKKGNDYLMYSSLALAYNLQHIAKNKSQKSSLDPTDMNGIEFEDEDGDGVADIVDLCPFTPSTVSVDSYGCPLDYDKDGVPDYLDQEPNSAPNAFVDANGVTLTDEDIENMYLVYSDSIGNLQFEKSATYTADIKLRNKKANNNNGYRVVIGNSASMSSDQISRMLSISDLKSEESASGIYYYIGNFDNPIEALSRKEEINELGIESHLVYNKAGKIENVDKADVDILKPVVNPSDLDPNQIVFRVQIGAYRSKLSKDVFSDVPELLVIEGNDGLTRYMAGSFPTIQDAAEYKIDLLLKGFEGAFVTSYRAGKRITLKEAGATVNSEEDIVSKEEASGSINSDFVDFTIQLGSFDGRVPAEVLSDYMSLGNVRPLRGSNGTTKYVYSKFETQKEAIDALRTLNEKGFGDAFVVGEFNGQIIPAAEAKKLKGQ